MDEIIAKLEAAKLQIMPSNFHAMIRGQGQNDGIDIAIAIVHQHQARQPDYSPHNDCPVMAGCTNPAHKASEISVVGLVEDLAHDVDFYACARYAPLEAAKRAVEFLSPYLRQPKPVMVDLDQATKAIAKVALATCDYDHLPDLLNPEKCAQVCAEAWGLKWE